MLIRRDFHRLMVEWGIRRNGEDADRENMVILQEVGEIGH